MKKLLTLFVSFILIHTYATGETPSTYFVSEPTLSPDGLVIVFSYENDLWRVAAEGGIAYRLTAMEGRETLPRYSPDGQWIAFTGSQNGCQNVYVMPTNGGEIKQLTFHDADDHVDSWSWDSKWIYFSSSRYNLYSTYSISVNGGTPIRVFEHYFNNPHHAVQHPKTHDYYFTESWESFMFPQRKRYKGDHSPQILSYNTTSKEFVQHTNYKGKNMWSTIDQDGNVYFVSDEYNDEYNLYQLQNGEKTLLTQFNASIKRPQISANGQKIVFEKDYQLWIYDVNSKVSNKLAISLYSNSTLELETQFDVDGKISNFDVSPDNKKIAFVSRGDLFVSDIKGKFVQRMPTNPAERVFEVKWTDDNLNLIFSQSAEGWSNWFSIAANGKEKEKQLTSETKTNRQMTLNSKRTQGVYLNGRDELKIIDFKSKNVKTIATDEIWGFQNSYPRFSPDDKYVAFTAFRSFEQDIFIYDVTSGNTINLTNTGVTEAEPSWSPDGKYIYFTTNRYSPNYPLGSGKSSIYRIPLYRFIPDLRTNAFGELFDKVQKKDTTINIKIDLNNINERWEQVKISGGDQYTPYLFKIKDETVLLFESDHDKGENAIWKTVYKPYESPKSQRLSEFELNSSYQVAQAKDDVYILANGNIHKADINDNKLENIEIKHNYNKQLRDEFNQMFSETWSTIQENFYDDKFHGIDWQKKRDYYSSILPHVRHRNNLRILLNDMLGELNASHMGFSSSGEEEKSYFHAYTTSIGVVFDNTNPYRIERIIRNSNIDTTDPLLLPGDILVAINGNKIDVMQNRESYLSFPTRQEELSLTVKRKGKEVSVVVPTLTTHQISELLYNEWIAENRAYVSQKSDGRVAYVYMKDMSEESLNQFLIDMTSHALGADALILDLRYNRGGNVHDEVLQFLSQRPYLQWKYREGQLSPQPNFAPSAKPIVLLMNEHSLSDAEMTAAGFRQLGLGKLIGTETYRWIIFTSGKELVDGSFVRIPAWGCYTLDGKNLEQEGVAPDIYVNTSFKDRLEAKDPQLDRAILEVLQGL